MSGIGTWDDAAVTDPAAQGSVVSLIKGLLSAGRGSTANTPAIVTAAGDALAVNSNRRVWTLQNLGTNPLFVRLGGTASSTVFHFILKAGTAADDGNGGFISDEIWKGLVSVAGTSPRFVVTEIT